MPKLIHEQTGLKIVENDKNGFTVVTLHYSADPRKRSEEWKTLAFQGLSTAKARQEYEIDYSAFMGERVFPEIKERRAEIVVREGPFLYNEWPRTLQMWGGFDYGKRNPSSFHVYTGYDGVLYALWELYLPCKNIMEFAKLMKECPYWDQIRYIAADPDIFSLRQNDMTSGVGTSVANQFETLGISKLVRASNDEEGWLSQMQKHWQAPEVTFKILESCPKMIEEFEMATYVSMSERQLETQNYREAMVDKHNHALDDCKYFMNSRPSVASRKVALPNLVGHYSPWGKRAPMNSQKFY